MLTFPEFDPTLRQSSLLKVYHYQTFRTDREVNSKEYLRTALRDRRLFLSPPHSVNDPWDCKPFFDPDPMIRDRNEREEFVGYLRDTTPALFDHPLRPVYEQMLLTDDGKLKEAVGKWTVGLQVEIAKRGIYCLTPFPDNTLMWSHYADNHRGICIEFDKNNDVISKARPIHYFAAYPALTAKSLRERPLQVVLNKSNEWGYEREWRLIGSRTVPGPLYMDGQFINLPDGAITAVIVGCENPFFDEVAALVAEHAPSVAVKRAVRDPKSYKLEIVVPTDEQRTDLRGEERSQYAIAGDSQKP